MTSHLYTLYMLHDNIEYALFTYEPQRGDPPSDIVVPPFQCLKSSNGKYELSYEFFEWISNRFFPYVSFIDHTKNIKLEKNINNIIPQKLFFRKTILF